ncbi:pyruvate dehydrogenase complex dihydrolipoamide acetyltransferase [Amaricoccus macauensis]|uniref:pyruvate dehydrogenase complex dihydrolipoamide acetyltransferase n=1 Tax=Amaricoccus macauensis TaxID=57001 RepID=UPI003C7A5615
MPVNILMPALSPTMEEGTLAKWLKKEGDTISSGDIIAEIETDKATMEFEAVDEGTLGKILIDEGTAGVKVNEPIAVLLEEGESADDIPADAGSGGGGDSDAAPEAASAPAPEAAPAAAAAATPAPAAPSSSSGDRIFASPLARRIAAEKGLDLTKVKGSGPHGRIVKADVESAKPEAAAPAKKDAPAAAAPAPATPASPNADAIKKMYTDRNYEEVTLDGMRKTIAARLTEAKQTIPHFYLRREIRLDALLKFRSQLNKELEERGVKLSVNDFIIKASALALTQVPDCNAVWAGDRVLKFERADVAVAVAIEGGLFTPVIRDADVKTMSAISAEMKDLAKRARDRKLAPHEYQGGSFAVSNLGMMGVENFDAVINPPHASILAVGAGVKKPIVNAEGEVEVATMMSVTLSVDHRVIDGALGAEWLDKLKTSLEKPLTMLT